MESSTGQIEIPFIPCSHKSTLIFLSVFSISLGLAWPVYLARLYTRWRILCTTGLDDLFMGLTVLSFTVLIAAAMTLDQMLDRVEYLDITDMSKTTNLLLVSEAFYILTMVLLKLSFSFFFLRIFIERWAVWTIKAVAAITVITGCVYLLEIAFQCGAPITMPAFWEKMVAHKCTPDKMTLAFAYSQTSIMAVTDAIYVFMPMHFVIKTRKPLREKFVISIILSIGATGGLASLCRIYWIQGLVKTDPSFFSRVAYLGIWSALEGGLGIVAGCLACLRPLVRQVSKQIRTLLGLSTASTEETPVHKTPPSPFAFIHKKLPASQRGMSILSDTTTGASMSTSASLSTSMGEKGIKDGDVEILSLSSPLELPQGAYFATSNTTRSTSSRWWRRQWWSPPQFQAGLMTEFDRGMQNANLGTDSFARTNVGLDSVREIEKEDV